MWYGGLASRGPQVACRSFDNKSAAYQEVKDWFQSPTFPPSDSPDKFECIADITSKDFKQCDDLDKNINVWGNSPTYMGCYCEDIG